MAIKLAINGFGRIGRNIVRALYESGLSDEIKIVAINELADPEAIAPVSYTHLTLPTSR